MLARYRVGPGTGSIVHSALTTGWTRFDLSTRTDHVKTYSHFCFVGWLAHLRGLD
jgi:hypothetical protein